MKEALEIVLNLGQDIVLPELGGAAHQFFGAAEGPHKAGLGLGEGGRLGKLLEEFGQLLDVVVGGDLAQEVGGAQGIAGHPLQFGLKADVRQADIDAGAVDRS